MTCYHKSSSSSKAEMLAGVVLAATLTSTLESDSFFLLNFFEDFVLLVDGNDGMFRLIPEGSFLDGSFFADKVFTAIEGLPVIMYITVIEVYLYHDILISCT